MCLFFIVCLLIQSLAAIPINDDDDDKKAEKQTEVNTRSWTTAEIARDADVGAHSLSLLSNVSPVYKYNLRPSNSPTHYLFIIINV